MNQKVKDELCRQVVFYTPIIYNLFIFISILFAINGVGVVLGYTFQSIIVRQKYAKKSN